MNFAIKLVKNVVTKEAGGNWGEPTETEYDLWAELLDPPSAFRTYEAQTQLGQVKRFRIRFKYNLEPTANWKIKFRGFEWTVMSIEPEKERMFYWIITARHK
jgi:head-tail adaptor